MAYTDRVSDAFTVESDTVLGSHTPTGAGTGYTRIGPANGGDATADAATDSVDCPFAVGTLQIRGWRSEFSGTWADDQETECDNMNTAAIIYIGTRIQDDGAGSADGYAGLHDGGANQWRIRRIDSGAETNLGNFFDNSPQASDVVTLQSEGTTHKLFENSTERISVTDSTYSSGGGPGIFARRTHNGQGPDNFVGRDQAAAGGVTVEGATASLVLSGQSATIIGPTGPGGIEPIATVANRNVIIPLVVR